MALRTKKTNALYVAEAAAQSYEKLRAAAERVWIASLHFGPVDDGRPEGDEFDEALLALRDELKRLRKA